MENFSHYFTLILSIGTLLLDIAIVLVLIWWFCQRQRRKNNKELLFVNIWEWLVEKSGKIAWLLALIATLGSLTYSDIIGYEPCKLCWLQRIFMYPQVVLLWAAWRNKLSLMRWYSFTLVIIGLIIAKYHYIIQVGWLEGGECGLVGYSASCSQRFVLNLGYITIPAMAATIFAAIGILLLVSWWDKK